MNRIILLLGAVFALLPFATPKAHSQSAPPKFRWQELTAAGGIADGRFQSQFIVPLDLRDDGSWFAVIYHADSAPNYVVVKGDRVTDVPFTGDGALYQMNASGDACGWEYTDPEETVASGVLRDRDGRLTAFAPPQGFPYAILNGISNNGQLVGQAYDEDFNSYAVRVVDGACLITPIPVDTVYSYFTSVNNDGAVAGAFYDLDFNFSSFVWDAAGFHIVTAPNVTGLTLSKLNNRGMAVGSGYLLPDSRGVGIVREANGSVYTVDYQPNWAPTRTFTLPSGEEVVATLGINFGSQLLSVNDSGRVLATAQVLYYYKVGDVKYSIPVTQYAIGTPAGH